MLAHTCRKMPEGFTNVTSATACTRKLKKTTRERSLLETESFTLNMFLTLNDEKTNLMSKSLQYYLTKNLPF